MDTTVIVALITAGFSFLGALVASALSNSKTLYRIEQLEKKMELHNNAILRLTIAETKIQNIENELNKVS